MYKREEPKLLEGCFIRDMSKPFNELQSELLHLFQCLCILRALLTALTTLSSALALVFKTIPISLVVETFGMVWELGELWDERV